MSSSGGNNSGNNNNNNSRVGKSINRSRLQRVRVIFRCGSESLRIGPSPPPTLSTTTPSASTLAKSPNTANNSKNSNKTNSNKATAKPPHTNNNKVASVVLAPNDKVENVVEALHRLEIPAKFWNTKSKIQLEGTFIAKDDLFHGSNQVFYPIDPKYTIQDVLTEEDFLVVVKADKKKKRKNQNPVSSSGAPAKKRKINPVEAEKTGDEGVWEDDRKMPPKQAANKRTTTVPSRSPPFALQNILSHRLIVEAPRFIPPSPSQQTTENKNEDPAPLEPVTSSATTTASGRIRRLSARAKDALKGDKQAPAKGGDVSSGNSPNTPAQREGIHGGTVRKFASRNKDSHPPKVPSSSSKLSASKGHKIALSKHQNDHDGSDGDRDDGEEEELLSVENLPYQPKYGGIEGLVVFQNEYHRRIYFCFVDDTPRVIAKTVNVDVKEILRHNRQQFRGLTATTRFLAFTPIVLPLRSDSNDRNSAAAANDDHDNDDQGTVSGKKSRMKRMQSPEDRKAQEALQKDRLLSIKKRRKDDSHARHGKSRQLQQQQQLTSKVPTNEKPLDVNELPLLPDCGATGALLIQKERNRRIFFCFDDDTPQKMEELVDVSAEHIIFHNKAKYGSKLSKFTKFQRCTPIVLPMEGSSQT